MTIDTQPSSPDEAMAGTPLVMHVIAGLGVGGAERMLANLVTADRPGAPRQCVVNLLDGGAFAAPIRDAGVPLIELGARSAAGMVGAGARLRGIIRRRKPDIIQSWMYYADLISTYALRASGRRDRTRHYWGVRCSDMLLDRYGRRLRWTVRRCAALSGEPAGIVFNSEAGRRVHEQLGFRPKQSVLIRNGVDPDRFQPSPQARERVRGALGIAPDAPLVVMAARVDPMKDYPMLMDVAQRLPTVTFAAAGRGTEALDDRPNLIGLGVRDDMAGLFAAADAAVLTSAFGEGFPNVLVEAMACGAPVVATEVGDAPAIVGDTGFVVAPGDAIGMASALALLLAETGDAKAGRAAAARQRVLDNFVLADAIAAFDRLHLTGAGPAA